MGLIVWFNLSVNPLQSGWYENWNLDQKENVLGIHEGVAGGEEEIQQLLLLKPI